MPILIEACIDSVESACAAEQGGADRLELNSALELDGLTPSPGLFEEVAGVCSLPIVVMIRPRSNGFIYTEAEFQVMLRDVDVFLKLGAKGIAVGCLMGDFSVDVRRTAEIVDRAGPMEVVFHRAFDITSDMHRALEELIDCGISRILTSGQATTALEGATRIAELTARAEHRIEILPGSGINASNALDIVEKTGCRQIHGTFKAAGSKTPRLTELDRLRAPAPAGTDAGVVRDVRAALRGM